jgi:dipeptide transport system permease protein
LDCVMLAYVAKRVLMTVPTFFGVTLVTFMMIRFLPGDPVVVMLGEQGVNPARQAEFRARFGLEEPLTVQYILYVKQLLVGDMGVSITTRQPVLDEFLSLFPATIELASTALLVAILLGVPFGVMAAVRRGSLYELVLMATSLIGYSMPIFWWGMLLIVLFSVTLGWTPVSGRISSLLWVEPATGFMLIDTLLSNEKGAFTSAARHLVLPTVVLATAPLALIARMTRSAMIEVIREDYILTARSKGLSPFRVVGLHAFRNALIPIVTVIGLQVSTLVTGAIMTETIFSWPGVGKWLVDAVFRRDYPVVQGGVLLLSCVVIAANLTTDLVYAIINPRLRPG